MPGSAATSIAARSCFSGVPGGAEEREKRLPMGHRRFWLAQVVGGGGCVEGGSFSYYVVFVLPVPWYTGDLGEVFTRQRREHEYSTDLSAREVSLVLKMMRHAILLALSTSTPTLIPPRAYGSLKLDDKLSARERGRIGHAVSIQNLVQRGEAATLDEAQKMLSMRGYASSLQRLVENGEAATLEEAQQVFGARGHAAALQNLVDSGIQNLKLQQKILALILKVNQDLK